MWWECGVSRGWGQLDQGRGCDLLPSFLFAFLLSSNCTHGPCVPQQRPAFGPRLQGKEGVWPAGVSGAAGPEWESTAHITSCVISSQPPPLSVPWFSSMGKERSQTAPSSSPSTPCPHSHLTLCV